MIGTEVNWLPWKPHPEVWLLVAFVIAAGIYAARVIQPKVVAAGEAPISGRQKAWFVLGVVLLWATSDWPIHDIGEDYLYSVHMFQHLMITFVVPPVMMLATPVWLWRLMLGNGRFQKVFAALSKPLVGAVLYNALVILSHWPAAVRVSVQLGPVHYLLHLALFASAILAWTPIASPDPDYRCSPAAGMIHLFLLSVVPTIPGGWLVAADGIVYRVYDRPLRMWGMTAIEDQQLAGVVMKVIGGFYLWVIIAVLFFKWMKQDDGDSPSKYRGKLVSVTNDETRDLLSVGSGPSQAPPAE